MLGAKRNGKDSHQQDDILELLRKYDEQKELLVQENKTLEARIFKEIDDSHKIRLAFEKKEAQYKRRIEQLERQLTRKRAEEEANSKQMEEYENMERELHENLQKYKESLSAANNIRDELVQMKSELKQKEAEKRRIVAENESLQGKISEQSRQIDLTKAEMSQLQNDVRRITEERIKFEEEIEVRNSEFAMYQQSLQASKTKCKDLKKKIKALESQLAQQHAQQHDITKEKDEEINSLHADLSRMEAEKDKLSQSCLSLSTKIEFLNLELNQKNSLLANMEAEQQKAVESQKQKEVELTLKNTALRSENERFEKQLYEYQEEVSRSQEQYREAVLAYELTFKSMKDKILVELIQQNRIGSGDEAIRRLQSCIDSMKKSSEKDSKIAKLKEKNQLLEEEIRSLKENRQKPAGTKSNKLLNPTVEPFNLDKVKLETQINYFEVELSLARKQLQELRLESAIDKEKLAEAREKLEDQTAQLSQLQSEAAKREKFYVDEITKCLNELQTYKERDIVSTEFLKEQKEFKEVYSLKVANYEKKIKQLVDGIERKDGLIEGLKAQKRQTEEAVIKLQDKVTKLQEEGEVVRKIRSDCARKDELMQQYKSRWEIKKNDFDQMQGERDQLRREKERLEKSLQRKAHYLQTVKAKYEKELGDIEKKLKSNSSHTKSISSVMQHKIMEMKKECVQYQEAFQQLATFMFKVIRQEKERRAGPIVRTRKSKSKRKVNLNEDLGKQESTTKSIKGLEAAKILGLKESEIDSFLNPQPEPLPEMEEELEELWRRSCILEFFEKAIDYLRVILVN